jgi:hypothetical protein
MARSKIEPGSHGEITLQNLPDGRVRGTLRYRRLGGGYGKVRVRANSTAARRSLLWSVEEQKQAPLGRMDELTPDSSFLALVRKSMDHVELTGYQRDRTRHENRRLIERKIAPHMGALAIRDIKPSTVLRVYKAIHNETSSTARNVKALISQICSYALMNDVMVANPAREEAPAV